MYSMALGPRCFKWKMLHTRSVVNVCAISKDFLFVSLVTNRDSLEEVCLPSFDVLNGWLNMAASCLDDENALPINVIAMFSATNSFNGSPQLGDICLLVQGLNKISPFLSFVCVDAVLDVIIQSWQYRRCVISFTEVISSCHHIQYLCWYRFLVESVSYSMDVCDAALIITVRFWQSVGRERLLRAVSTSCLYLAS